MFILICSFMRSLTVCVDYDDLLSLTLSRNLRHFEETLVVTSPTDDRTIRLAESMPKVRVYCTDAFYRRNAYFAKGAAIEEAFDVLGREGWIVIWDADIVMPEVMDLSMIVPGNLYTPNRLFCEDPKQWKGQMDWTEYKTWSIDEWGFWGYFQLFHASDPVLRDYPWYTTDWAHASASDAEFQNKWPMSNKIRPPFHVLHLGQHSTNNFGRVTPRVDGLPQKIDPQIQLLNEKAWADMNFVWRDEFKLSPCAASDPHAESGTP